MRSLGLRCTRITPAGLCQRICYTSGVLRPVQTFEYFSSRNELHSQGSNLELDCHGLAMACMGSCQALVPAATETYIPIPHLQGPEEQGVPSWPVKQNYKLKAGFLHSFCVISPFTAHNQSLMSH